MRFLFLFLLLLTALPLLAADPPIRPDPNLTPGAVLEVTKDDICTPGYTKKVRDVPSSVKAQVYALYGITSHEPGEYEIDHLIPLELGGSNSIKNLFPQSYRLSGGFDTRNTGIESPSMRELSSEALR